MSSELSTRNVTKFDGTNFLGWKFQVTQLFVMYGVYDVVTGERVEPANRDTEAGKKWITDNAKAMCVISTTMEYAQLECLFTCGTAKQMWDKLGMIHAHKSASNRLLLTQRFHEYRMKTTDSVVQHVAKVQNMASQLADLGERVSDVTIMAKILASLTAKFAAFQTAWDSVEPDRQTIQNLQERLLREESRLSDDADGAMALAAMKISKSSSKEDTKSKGKKKPRVKKDVECYVCQEKGHFARDCPERKRKQGKRTDSTQNKDKDKDSTQNCAFIAIEKNKHDRYVVPSGEQRHKLLSIDQ